MRCLISLALLAAAAPAASVLDDTVLVQGAVERRGVYSLDYAISLDNSMAMELDEEGHDLAQYGPPIELTVHPVSGDDLPVILRSGMRLHILMRSVCRKLGLDISAANFTKDSRPLDPHSTASAFGLVAGDVVEVSTPELKKQALAEEGLKLARERTAEREKNAEYADQANEARMAARAEKRRKVAMKVAQVAAEQKRKHEQELHDLITLKFISPNGQQGDVSMGVKRGHWLDGYLELVAKRMGVARAKTLFLFRDDDGNMSPIEPHDSAQTLGLQDEESIVVKAARN